MGFPAWVGEVENILLMQLSVGSQNHIDSMGINALRDTVVNACRSWQDEREIICALQDRISWVITQNWSKCSLKVVV